jgi:hypothetical protein
VELRTSVVLPFLRSSKRTHCIRGDSRRKGSRLQKTDAGLYQQNWSAIVPHCQASNYGAEDSWKGSGLEKEAKAA